MVEIQVCWRRGGWRPIKGLCTLSCRIFWWVCFWSVPRGKFQAGECCSGEPLFLSTALSYWGSASTMQSFCQIPLARGLGSPLRTDHGRLQKQHLMGRNQRPFVWCKVWYCLTQMNLVQGVRGLGFVDQTKRMFWSSGAVFLGCCWDSLNVGDGIVSGSTEVDSGLEG